MHHLCRTEQSVVAVSFMFNFMANLLVQAHLFEQVDFERKVIAAREGSVHPYEDDITTESLRSIMIN